MTCFLWLIFQTRCAVNCVFSIYLGAPRLWLGAAAQQGSTQKFHIMARVTMASTNFQKEAQSLGAKAILITTIMWHSELGNPLLHRIFPHQTNQDLTDKQILGTYTQEDEGKREKECHPDSGATRDSERVSAPEVVANPNIYLKKVFFFLMDVDFVFPFSLPTKLHLSDEDVCMHCI